MRPSTTEVSSDVPVAIDDFDPGTVTSMLTVADDAAIRDINVRLDIEHRWNPDLIVTLISPMGTRVELFGGIGTDGTGMRAMAPATVPYRPG